MTKYRKKPEVIEAVQWFKNGDHPLDKSEPVTIEGDEPFLSEGKIVRRFNRPDVEGFIPCKHEHCSLPMFHHGWIDTLAGGHIVCPGDMIITNARGEIYPCKKDIFDATYEKSADCGRR